MAHSEKQSVALVSMLASAVLAAGKLAAGLFTGSLGILSEAIHGLLDFATTVMTLFAVRWSDAPPDEEHHYGHGKAESVSALIATGFLFLTTGWIVYEAARRLLYGHGDVAVTWWAAAIVLISIAVDYNRAAALRRVERKTSSEALEADALHFSSDMWSSAAVLLGLAGVWAGFAVADALAALAVSAFVGLAGFRLGQRTLATLLDTAPEGATERIRAIVAAEPAVLRLARLRLRPAGGTLFAGVVIDVARTMAVDDIVALKQRLTRAIAAAFPNADTTVTTNPVALDGETVFQRVMLIAQRQALAIHHLTVQHVGGKMAVSFDLEVPGSMGLGQAHEVATGLEEAIRIELGHGVEVESHIEPLPDVPLRGADATGPQALAVTAALRALADMAEGLTDLHDIRIRRTDDGLYVHYHCRFDPAASVERVHDTVDRIERALRDATPAVRRVIAHAEPAGRARLRF